MTIIKAWLGLAALASALAFSSAAQAQTPDGELSVGTNFVPGACLESRGVDSTIVINKCNAQPNQALVYSDKTGQITQGTKCLAVQAKGEPLAIKDCADIPAHKWNYEGGGIRNDVGLCADILNFQRDPGTPVIAWDCTGTENQKFFATRIRLGTAPAAAEGPKAAGVRIMGVPSIASYFVQGRCLAYNSGEIRVDTCSGKANQTFQFKDGVSGQIVQGDKCLASDNKGGALVLKACAVGPAQDWTFNSEGTLRNRANLCADIINFDTKPGARVIAWDCTATDNQKWYPAIAAEAGTFTLGSALAKTLREAGGTTTVSMSAGYSGQNMTGAGGRALSADDKDMIRGGQSDVIIVGGAGVLTVRFLKGLAAPNVRSGDPSNILPKDWSFFSGATAGSIAP